MGRRSTQDLVLLLQEPVAILQLTQLERLLGRDTTTGPVLDLGLLHPAVQTSLGDPEVPRDLVQRRLPLGLLRWADMPFEALLQMLRSRFDRVGDEDTT